MATITVRQHGAQATGAGWGWMLASGVLAVFLGLLALAWPFPATFAATLIIGSLFMAVGVIALAAGLFAPGHGRRGYLVAYGLLSIVAGLLLLLFPVSGALTLTLFLTAWLLVRGVMELVAGFSLRRHRAMMLVLGVINIILAALVYFGLPWSALTLPGVVLGVSLLFGGASELVAALAHRRGESVAA